MSFEGVNIDPPLTKAPTLKKTSPKKKSQSKIYDSKSSIKASSKAHLSKSVTFDSKGSLNNGRKTFRFVKNVIYTRPPHIGIDEIIKLQCIIDEQKDQNRKQMEEIKTLRLVNNRNDKEIKKLDKDKMNLPKTLHSLNEQLRLLKMDKNKFQERILISERQQMKQSEELTRVKNKLKEFTNKKKIVAGGGVIDPDVNEDILKKFTDMKYAFEEIQKKLKIVEAERDREIRLSKSSNAKFNGQIEMLRAEINRKSLQLIEKDKQINSLSIYTTHAAERSKSRSRSRAKIRTPLVENFDYKPDFEPFDSPPIQIPAIVINLERENRIEGNGPTIHKPDFHITKSPVEALETVDEILARRMRDHLASNDDNVENIQ